MNYSLPTSVEIGGAEYEIRSDFRAALDICTALTDTDLSDDERAFVVLDIFYPGLEDMPRKHYEEAVQACIRFINGGEEDRDKKKKPRLVSWEQDFHLICAPVNRVMGRDIRGMEYLHWWSFLAAYMEIGECLFAQVVGIRSKKAKGIPLDKSERKWYNENRDIVDIRTTYTDAEEDLLRAWGGSGA